MTLPAINANALLIGGHNFDELDLSAVTADHVGLGIASIQNSVIWPVGMISLDLQMYEMNTFGTLPDALTWLHVQTTSPYCLPHLPDALTNIALDTNTSCLPNIPSSLLDLNCSCMVDASHIRLCSVLTNDCPGVNSAISGYVFQDLDQNGVLSIGEPALPQVPIVVEPSGNMTICNAAGYWNVGVLPGEHTISTSSSYPYIQSVSPAQHTASLPDYGLVDSLNNFAVTLIPDIEDLRLTVAGDPPRPGFDNRLFISCQNYGTLPTAPELPSLSMVRRPGWAVPLSLRP
ncbi:MAG: hypothetical protein IPH05_17190 [Flavobacteriales bacterium]|nr:hypothetical protein [Flavobacteriales bacterium]